MAEKKEPQGVFAQLREGGLLARLYRAAGKVADEVAPVIEHGAHESASLLYRGEGFVMYPKAGKEADADKGRGRDGGR